MQRAAARKRRGKGSCSVQRCDRGGGRPHAACNGPKTAGEAPMQRAATLLRRRQDSCSVRFRCRDGRGRLSVSLGSFTDRIGTEKRIYNKTTRRHNRADQPFLPIEHLY